MDMIPKETLYVNNINDKVKPHGTFNNNRNKNKLIFFIFIIWRNIRHNKQEKSKRISIYCF